MGARSKAYEFSMALARGETQVQLEFEQALIPIMKEKGEMELELQQKSFEQQLKQAKEMHLLSQQLAGKEQPVFVTTAPAVTAAPNYMLYIGLAIAAYFLFFR